uniref:Uncharacterized protein n=1 Tax=Caenorhabditis japonica TaxID=281687 RepID=A0A8R1HNP5_CAEJA
MCRTLLAFTTFAVLATLALCQEDAEAVHLTGSFRVAAEGEELPKSGGFATEHPFFQLEGMKIARAYLDRQYAKEREQEQEQRFGA